MGKSAITSKTVWVNFVIGLAVLVGTSFDLPGVTAFAQSPLAISMVTGGANLVLRFLTDKPITSIV